MLQIKHLQFTSPVVLAPLAGYTDLPFRLLCQEFGAGFAVSEMISSHGLIFQKEKTLAMLRSSRAEKPFVVQIFGADPEIMAAGAEIMQRFSPDIIDINMGCPVKKVTKKGAGAALMTEPVLAEKIIRAVVARVSVPVTVKIRAGKDATSINAADFAKMAEDAGVSAIAIHARTWAQGFTGLADHRIIASVKRKVSVPVIGNGDISSLESARKMMVETGCDGAMIGRAALGNPWVFQEKGKPQDAKSVLEGARRHLDLMVEHLPGTRVIGYVKNHISRYVKGMDGAASLRSKIFATADISSLSQLLDHLIEESEFQQQKVLSAPASTP
ncbi:MAG: tRNA dihydrouridine synthase DusB [Deltaproteobacteria bacterium]|nr:MAG: tRNA dihydrouridine synthase DusB [Deltaproteobacteria bacterium]